MTLNNIGQLLTLLSYIIFWVSRFFKSKNSILILDSASRIFTIASFLCLGSMNGIQNTLFVLVRNYCGQKVNSKSTNVKRVTFVVLLMALSIMYTIFFEGVSTVILYICAILNLIGVILCEEQGLRLFGLGGSLFYAIFLFMIGNTVGFICEVICAVVLISSYLIYRNKTNVKEN